MRLLVPKGTTTRPTADRIKESLFNILGPRVLDASVLDLFAGSGALGIEALSRGATKALFVDADPASVATIRANIERTRFGDVATVIRARLPYWHGLIQFAPFDLIFIDPPYNRGLVLPTLAWIDEANVCAPEATVVVEHSPLEEIPPTLQNLKPFRERTFSESRLTLLSPQGSH